MVRRNRNRISIIQSDNADVFDINVKSSNRPPSPHLSSFKEKIGRRYLPGWVASTIYSGLIFFYLLAFSISYFLTELPYDSPISTQKNYIAPLKQVNIPKSTTFLPNFAYEHLEVVCNKTHSFNQKASNTVREYLISYVKELKVQINSNIELIDDVNTNITFVGADTPSGTFGNSNITGYFESSNVLVRIPGTNLNNNNALLVSAHYDSVPLSYGANDNGIGLVTALEIMRLAAIMPQKHDLIFNLNNHEEAGLLGSIAFIKHPWSKLVKSFINLEGSGAGGRVVLFQCSNPQLVELARAIPRPHLSVLGNDLFQLRVLNSVTDFAIYSQNGRLPGVDFAIYNNRAFYHTIKDDLSHSYLSTIENMGQSIWPLTSAILESDFLDSNPKVQTAGIFYDFLGLAAFHYSFSTDLAVGVSLMIMMILSIAVYLFMARRYRVVLPATCWRGLFPPLRALLSLSMGVIMFFAIGYGINTLILKVNLLAIHGHWVLVYMFNASFAVLCFVGCDWCWRWMECRGKGPTFSLGSAYRRFQASSLAMMLFWFLALILQRLTGVMQVGLLYYVTWFGYCFFVIYVVSAVFDPIDYWVNTPRTPRPKDLALIALQIVCMCFIPALLLHDSAKSTILSLSQSLITGTSGFFVYTFVSVFSMTTVLPFVPFIAMCSDHHRWTFTVLILLSTSLLIATLLVTPLSESAPMTFYWTQVYNLDTGASPVLIRGLSGLAAVAPMIVNATSRGNNSFKYTDAKPFSMVTYEGLLPNFSVEPKQIVNITSYPSDNTTKRIKIEAIDTRKCRVLIPTIYSIQNMTVTTMYGNTYPLSTEITKPRLPPSLFATGSPTPSHVIFLLRRSFNNYPWELKFQFTPSSSSSNLVTLDVTCYYDDFEDHIPAMKLLHKDYSQYLPDWATLSTGSHILEVKTSMSV